MEISEKLKLIRERLRLSQHEMGRKFGVTLLTYHLWEKGAFNPRFDRIAKAEEMYEEVLAEQKKEVA